MLEQRRFEIIYELPEDGINLPQEIQGWEIHRIQQALRRTEGHRGRSAELLGINRTTFYEKMKRLGLTTVSGRGH